MQYIRTFSDKFARGLDFQTNKWLEEMQNSYTVVSLFPFYDSREESYHITLLYEDKKY